MPLWLVGAAYLGYDSIRNADHDIMPAVSRRVLNRTAIKWVSVAAGLLLIGLTGYFVYEFIMDLMAYIKA